jgi:hypothetical protein
MKMATIDVFGKAALNVDFGCCEGLQLSSIAFAFDYLTIEYTRRLQKPWDPFSFLYNIPTKSNLEHRRQRQIIRTFISQQISKTRQEISSLESGTKDSSSSMQQQRSLSSSSSTGDLLSNLIKAADANSEDDVTDDALGDVMMTLLFGGYDTTRYDLIIVFERRKRMFGIDVSLRIGTHTNSFHLFHFFPKIISIVLR